MTFTIHWRSRTLPNAGVSPAGVHAARIDLRQPRSRLGHASLRSPDPAAQREIDAETAAFIQHVICTFERAFGPVKPLSGSRQFHIHQFHIQKFHYSGPFDLQTACGRRWFRLFASVQLRRRSGGHSSGARVVAPVA
ncbi:hypothetical protein [Mesorhizobium sp. M0296]|uniref:hypothetical protein n=1 Tax=Mesorhizobium sp. M0296 TaxID=2956931 RepID=UPI003334CD3F